MSFPPFILLRLTVHCSLFHRTLTTAVQSVDEPCNIAVYLHSQKLYKSRVINIFITVIK